jgi:hypothetical protein
MVFIVLIKMIVEMLSGETAKLFFRIVIHIYHLHSHNTVEFLTSCCHILISYIQIVKETDIELSL